MSKIKSAIESCINGPMQTGRTLTSRFLFPPEFIGFQGHFPGKKVLPGTCQIQCVLSTIEKGERRPVRLREIVLAKYPVPVFPDEEITCTVGPLPEEGDEFIVKASITKGAAKVAEIKLRVALQDGE